MRIEHLGAYALGALLPIVEVARRRTDFSNLPAYVDDFLMGALLLIAARSVSKGRPAGPVLLPVAWAVFCGAMYYSFFGQLSSTAPRDISGLANGLVVGVKGIMIAFGILALVLSVRAATPSRSR
jgi:hypothetical protein